MESVKKDARPRSTRHGFLSTADSHLRRQRSAAYSPVSSDGRSNVVTPPRDESETSSSVDRSKLTPLASDGLAHSKRETRQRSSMLVRPFSTQSRTVVDHSLDRATRTPITSLTTRQLVSRSASSVRRATSHGAFQKQKPGIYCNIVSQIRL